MITESRRILLTGGRAPAVLHLARLLKAEGHRIFMAESLGQHLCRFSTAVEKSYRVPEPRNDPEAYLDALVAIVRRHSIDLVIPACEEIFYVARGREAFPEGCRVLCDHPALLEKLHDKDAFVRTLRAHGLDAPRTFRADSRAGLERLWAEAPKGRYVLKPVFSRFGSEVRFLDVPADACPGVDIGPARPWVLQEFIAGREFCSYSVANEGRLSAHCAYPRRYTAGHACVHFEAAEVPRIRAWVEEFVRRENFTGQIAFDFIEAGDKLFAVECNPRATSGLHLFEVRDGLGKAFFGESDRIIEPSTRGARMLALPMLMYGWRSPGWGRALGSSRDAIFDRRDPLPFLHQPALVLTLWWRSRRHAMALAAAATADIEWNGDGT